MAESQPQAPIAAIDPAGEIRVFVLDPGSGNDKLQGRFEVVTFDPDTRRPFPGSVEWVALSYVWGGQSPTEQIQIDNGPRSVTPNVVSMLRDLRRPDEPRNVWIDSICINQSDDDEKAQQVGIMLQVYQNATSVIIWLKEHRTEIRASLAASKWMKNLLSRQETFPESATGSLQRCFDVYCKAKEMYFQNSRPVVRLLSNTWFSRVWIIQEAAVARELFVSMDGELLPWDTLVNLGLRFAPDLKAHKALSLPLSEFYRHCLSSLAETEAGRGVSMIYLVQRLRNVQQASARMLPPSELAHLAVGRRATIPHDMIYAMNGLFRLWASHFPISVDYKFTSAEEVFQEFSVNCIEHEQNLDVLSQIRYRSRADEGSSGLWGRLPSWAMDWSAESIGWYQQASPPANALAPPFASPLSSPYEVLCDRRGQVLRLRGFIVDEMGLPPYSAGAPEVSAERLEEINRLPRLWRDGDRPHSETDLGDKFMPHGTKSGGVVFTFGYESFRGAIVCYLVGSRHPIVLSRACRRHGADQYRIEFGTCIMEGFEDGKGVEKALEMGLQMHDILIV
ncbi:heterokaryon incompatibility [Fusarium beomiforme]|uniref:Heterokaryon incompatibility n=1 Tax=Fusarium beomiforme TaxID=44412 RepID=A0A9P5AR00_9HYPO|nr:heterokaryon incompatibility [Fusarium beomiforme]